ncbi:hypothetical protein TNCV_4914771 [Trichonephila clavipes]|nr:hypothetical protein TNCV_4914771 [Trichonephila clavipes]
MAMSHGYAVCKRSLECLSGLGAFGKIKILNTVSHRQSSDVFLWGETKKSRERSPALDGEKGKALPWIEKAGEESPGWNGLEESAKEKGLVRDWSEKMMNAGGVENRI